MQITLKSLFATPLIRFKFSKHHLYNFPDIPKKHKKPDGWVRSLNSSFGETEGDSFFPLDTKNKLTQDIIDDLKVVFESLDLPTNIHISDNDIWYNVYHDEQGQEKHDHICSCVKINSFWCGVYYNKNPSPTTFYNNQRYHKLTYVPEIDNSKLSNFFSDQFEPEVEPGDIILFPPWLEHSVEPNNHNMRLTFAFNLSYTL